MMYHQSVPPVYLDFEDAEFWKICCENWGDYNETVVTDNGDDTVNIIVTFKSMLNNTLKKSKIISSENNIDNTGGEYTPGTTVEAVGITLAQCAAVSSVGTIFANTDVTKCNELKYFTGITSINKGGFRSCKMSSITLPNSLITIGQDAFRSCVNLTEMIVPEGVTSTGQQWIWDSYQVALIDLPSTITTLTGYGIQPYRSTQVDFNVICRAINPPTLGSSAYLTKLVKVYVPDNSVDAYKAANKWSDFATKIVGLSTYSE